MCNIAGYVGSRDATPILLKMIKIQEGFNGGFFSGLAVHNGETIHYRKKMGDFATLLRESDAADLSGKMGIIHSRTPSGGDGTWAHPFVSERGGEVKLCYVANGGPGLFQDRQAEGNCIANALQDGGFDIPCKLNLPEDAYCRLADGSSVHMSDVMCQLIYKYKMSGMDTVEAMTAAFCEMPSEIVGLAMEKDAPDKIFFSRINYPMFVAFDDTGAYLASSPIAFPEHVKEYRLLPALSSGVVYRDRCEVVKYPNSSIKVRGFNRRTVQKARAVILERLSLGEHGFVDMTRAFQAYLPKKELIQLDAIVYMALYELLTEGKISMRSSEWTVNGQTAPHTLFRCSEL